MKRSTTKQKIRHAEKRLASEVVDCLAHWHAATDDWRRGMLENLGLWLTGLLSFHLELDFSWSRDRWLDGIEDLSVSIEGVNVLHLKGILWWGLLSNIGGAETPEPLEGKLCLTGRKHRPLAYKLNLGNDQERRHFSRAV